MRNADRADAAEETAPELDAPATPRSGQNKTKNQWVRQAHSTHGETKREQAAVSLDEPYAGADAASQEQENTGTRGLQDKAIVASRKYIDD
uniref:Uncharacterized protein n=1 Tax=Hyaloperonospora arabidopsidis (strain Emoy2) TaxID=559515 RepID=M4BRN5_HYAAE